MAYVEQVTSPRPTSIPKPSASPKPIMTDVAPKHMPRPRPSKASDWLGKIEVKDSDSEDLGALADCYAFEGEGGEEEEKVVDEVLVEEGGEEEEKTIDEVVDEPTFDIISVFTSDLTRSIEDDKDLQDNVMVRVLERGSIISYVVSGHELWIRMATVAQSMRVCKVLDGVVACAGTATLR